jgi:hypothetical protein
MLATGSLAWWTILTHIYWFKSFEFVSIYMYPKKQCLATFGKAIHPNNTGIFWCLFGFNMTGGIGMILYKLG